MPGPRDEGLLQIGKVAMYLKVYKCLGVLIHNHVPTATLTYDMMFTLNEVE